MLQNNKFSLVYHPADFILTDFYLSILPIKVFRERLWIAWGIVVFIVIKLATLTIIVVMDVVGNSQHKKVFLLAQSFMPAQNLQVLQYDQGQCWFTMDKITNMGTGTWLRHGT